jgi:hypothetical protein
MVTLISDVWNQGLHTTYAIGAQVLIGQVISQIVFDDIERIEYSHGEKKIKQHN